MGGVRRGAVASRPTWYLRGLRVVRKLRGGASPRDSREGPRRSVDVQPAGEGRPTARPDRNCRRARDDGPAFDPTRLAEDPRQRPGRLTLGRARAFDVPTPPCHSGLDACQSSARSPNSGKGGAGCSRLRIAHRKRNLRARSVASLCLGSSLGTAVASLISCRGARPVTSNSDETLISQSRDLSAWTRGSRLRKDL